MSAVTPPRDWENTRSCFLGDYVGRVRLCSETLSFLFPQVTHLETIELLAIIRDPGPTGRSMRS